ncbi:MAG TPA: coenzyme F420-0:L-glutamate ligase [Candidatus Nitrosotenuis sp.]|nr:coenzyme F420-0:L-glutamate ligase [Candidatus Nitrosotenuis sp.]
MSLEVTPVKVERRQGGFDLYQDIVSSLNGKVSLEDGDVLVISSKYAANSQNRIVDIEKIKSSEKSRSISERFHLDSKTAEIVLRESDKIFGGVAGFVLTSSDDILAPNAGIDKSNVRRGRIILYPDLPYSIAEQLRRKIFLDFGIHVGIIIVDSRLMPARIGTTGVAISCAGLEPVHDMRGQRDLDGNPLKVTLKATADNLATIANHKMGEGSESTPVAVIKNSGVKLTDRKIRTDEMAISHDQCVYVRGFRSGN